MMRFLKKLFGRAGSSSELSEMIEDADHLSVSLAIRAVFDSGPMEAYDRLIAYFDAHRAGEPGGDMIPAQVLCFFGPSSFTNKGPLWTEPRAPGWLAADRRWLDLCVRLRHDEVLGSAARHVLRYVPAEILKPSLDAAVAREGPRSTGPRAKAVGDLVSRYRNGQHVEVWRILRTFDAIDGDLRAEAEAVSVETMKRVAHNVDLLASRFEARGWVSRGGQFRTLPLAEDARIIARIEKVTGAPLPPSLLAFWHVVGGVDFVWDYEQEVEPPSLIEGLHLGLDSQDPLNVDSPATPIYLDHIEYCLDSREAEMKETHPELIDPFSLDLAPDYLHKTDTSGGPAYAIELPFLGADPTFRNEVHRLPFVDYLRHCLRWGGFGHLEHHSNENHVTELVATLTEGFEPF